MLTIDHSEDAVDSENEDDGEEGVDEEDLGFVSRQDNQPSDEDMSSPSAASSSSPSSPKLQPGAVINARRRRYKHIVESQPTSEDSEGRPITGPMSSTGDFRY